MGTGTMKNSIGLYIFIFLSLMVTGCAKHNPFQIIQAVQEQKELARNCKAGTIQQMRACSLKKEQQVSQITNNIEKAKKY